MLAVVLDALARELREIKVCPLVGRCFEKRLASRNAFFKKRLPCPLAFLSFSIPIHTRPVSLSSHTMATPTPPPPSTVSDLLAGLASYPDIKGVVVATGDGLVVR